MDGRSGGGSGGSYTECYLVDSSLEAETRAFMAAMGGPQPLESEWGIFFCRHGGGMSGDLHDRMKAAHNIAKSRFSSSSNSTEKP